MTKRTPSALKLQRMRSTSEHATVESLSRESDPELFRHRGTRFLHIIADPAGDRFRCGREISERYERLEAKPKFCSPQRRQCFRS